VSRADDVDVLLERVFVRMQAKAPALVVGSTGWEHAQRDVLAPRARIEPGRDFAKGSVAAHCNHRLIRGSLQRGPYGTDRFALWQRWQEISRNPGRGQQRERSIDSLLIPSALRGRVTDQKVSSHRCRV
jgi:hypothetical protein